MQLETLSLSQIIKLNHDLLEVTSGKCLLTVCNVSCIDISLFIICSCSRNIGLCNISNVPFTAVQNVVSHKSLDKIMITWWQRMTYVYQLSVRIHTWILFHSCSVAVPITSVSVTFSRNTSLLFRQSPLSQTISSN